MQLEDTFSRFLVFVFFLLMFYLGKKLRYHASTYQRQDLGWAAYHISILGICWMVIVSAAAIPIKKPSFLFLEPAILTCIFAGTYYLADTALEVARNIIVLGTKGVINDYVSDYVRK